MFRSLKPLQNSLFRRLWFGNMAANLGTMFQAVGAAWLMTTMTGSPQMVALVQTSITLPLLFLSLLAGVLADTFDRRRIMLFIQLYMFATAAVLTLISTTGLLTPNLLLLFTFLIGCGGAILIPCWQASLRELVGRPDLPSAVAIHSMGFNLMRSAGPAIGGAILALAGASVVFAVGGICYLVFATLLATWRRHGQQDPMREPLASAFLSGIRYSAMSPQLIYVFLRGAVFCFLAVSLVALLPLMTNEMYGGGSVLFGVFLGSYGLGSVLAAVISPGLRERYSTENIVRLTFLTFGVSLLLAAFVHNLILAVAATFIAGCCWVLTNSTLNVTIQLSIPAWVAGRSISILHTGLFGGMAIGSLIWGMVAEATDIETALAISAAGLLATVFMGKLMPLPAIVDDKLEPADRFQEPERKLERSELNGTINVTIHYRVPSQDTSEFLSVMAERKRIRKRDGALNWALMRDVERPDIWSETYSARNWDDYVRHNKRRTKADITIHDSLWSLHRGTHPPVVQRMVEWDVGKPPRPKNPE